MLIRFANQKKEVEMLKTLVIFRLPDNTLVSCDLSKLAAFPVAGHTYLFNKQQFEVVDAVEPLTAGGGNTQLMDLIALEFDTQAEAVQALASMVNLDAKADGKITLAVEPDKVVLVRLKKPTKGSVKGKQRVSPFTLDIQSLLAGNQPTIDTGAPTGTGRSRRRTPRG